MKFILMTKITDLFPVYIKAIPETAILVRETAICIPCSEKEFLTFVLY
jgi:hypothetical protein